MNLAFQHEAIPSLLQDHARWVLWHLDSNGKKTPRAVARPSRNANATNPTNWAAYAKACETARTHGMGIGFALGPVTDGLTVAGVDLDQCRNPETGVIEPWAQRIVDYFNSYTEISPSGTGLKIFLLGSLPDGAKQGKVYKLEIYDHSRYFTVTGNHLTGTPRTVEPREAKLRELHEHTWSHDLVRLAKVFGLFLNDEDPEWVFIHCPWEDNHSPGNQDRDAGLHRTNGTIDGFHCFHAGCDERTLGDVREFFGLKRSDSLPADAVRIRGGDLTAIVDRAEAALLASGTPIYQRGGVLTRAIRLDTAMGDEAPVRRDAGSIVLIPVREPWLVEQMGRTLKWVQETKHGETFKDPPAIYPRTLLGRSEWRFPVLRGVVTAPTLDRDGRIIATRGFDTTSGLLLDFAPGAFPPIAEHPTPDEACAALGHLTHPLRAFPFVDDAAKSVAVAAMLTGLVRVSLRTAPLHGFDAPTAGMGKSLLAEAVGLLATGFRPPALSQGKSPEEDEKRLSTVLFAGDPVIHIDNCDREIAGDFLCSMLTQEIVQARILGLSERRVLPSTTLVLASGNNLTFAGDTARRAVVCRLDAQVERPDTRSFDFDVHAEILADRPRLVVAGLTVLRAYAVAGRPVPLTPMGSFTDWEWIRGALVWLGHADPADTRAAITENDPRKNELLEVMELWEAAFGTTVAVEVADIQKRAEAYAEAHAELETREPIRALRDKFIEAACRGGKWSGKSAGWWLRRHKDRVVGTRCFTCEPGGDGQRWRLRLTTVEKPGKPALPGF